MTRRLACALVVIGALVWVVSRQDPVAIATRAHAPAPEPAPARIATSAPAHPADTPEARYPVDLSALRARIPDNRYWELGVPTDDPIVARSRADRAKRENDIFGRTQSGEATKQEIRDYYAERRRISQDYLDLSLLVLAEQGDQLPERDRGLFELSAQLHRARLTQIERDLSDALARRGDRP